MNREPAGRQDGVIVAIRGSVVDMRFEGTLPAFPSLLRAGDGGRVARVSIEALAQRDARHVRGIALSPTQGLARGMPVEDTGGPLQAPVGKAILSRMFDVFGNTTDRGPPHNFAAGSMGPQVEGERALVLATGQRAVIGSLDRIEDMIAGTAGTQVCTEAAGGADTL